MTILMGLDQHRAQITAEWVDTSTGEVSRARVAPADRAGVRRFLARFRGRQLEVALEATTGCRFVVEELQRIGAGVHLAEPADTAALRGNKKRAKNDRADARHLRELLMAGRLPESWIPPAHILDLRARVRLRHALSEDRGEWQQRIQSVLYHHGCPRRGDLINRAGLAWLAAQPLPGCAREQVTVALAMIDALERQLAPLDKELRRYARRQPGCKALMRHYGVGALTAVTILAELGDPHRFSSSREAVRFSGLDITVHASDQRRAPGHLSRQGPPALRWVLFEAAQCARRPSSPDHASYQEAAKRLGGKITADRTGVGAPRGPRPAARTRLSPQTPSRYALGHLCRQPRLPVTRAIRRDQHQRQPTRRGPPSVRHAGAKPTRRAHHATAIVSRSETRPEKRPNHPT
jgi:transposase